MSNPKVVVFGVDGATFNVMRPLIEKGRLPHLAKLIKNGVSGPLQSTVPPVTAPAWVSFMTGVNPGRHGIFHFVTNSHLDYEEGTLLGSAQIGEKTLWQVLTDHNKKMILVSVPMTYPPTPISGVMVCGGGDRLVQRIATYPQELNSKINEIFGFEETEAGVKFTASFTNDIKEAWLDAALNKVKHFTQKIKETSLYLMGEHEWDFLMVYFLATDALQHHFWSFMDPAHPAYDPRLALKYGEEINKSYETVDAAIGELLTHIDPSSYIVVLSDHGFGPLQKTFFVNKWLEKIGLLKVKEGWFKQRKFGLYSPTFYRILSKVGLGFLGRLFPEFVRQLPVPILGWKRYGLNDRIDWRRTKAYGTAFGININKKDREPQGIVAPGKEYEEVVQKITASLKELEDPEIGERVVDRIIRKEEAYHGPHMEEANDIFFTIKEMAYAHGKDLDAPALFKPVTPDEMGTGSHRFEGVFSLHGPGVKQGATLSGAEIIDVMPTLLHLMGLPVREGLDGKVLLDALEPDFLSREPVSFASGSEQRPAGEVQEGISKEDERQILEQLKTLGYMG